MISRRTWLRFLCLLLVLMLLGGYGYFSLGRLLERQHVQHLDWQAPRLALDGLHLGRLELLQQSPAGQLQLRIERLHLGWGQFGLQPPYVQQVRAERLSMAWHPVTEHAASTPARRLDLKALGEALAILPLSLSIDELLIDLPCAKGRCQLRGDLQQSRSAVSAGALDLRLNLASDATRLNLEGRIQSVADATELQLALAVNDRPQLSLHSRLQDNADGTLWRGELSAPTLDEATALREWLRDWLLPMDAAPAAAPSTVQLAASWQLQLPRGDLDINLLRRATGHITANGALAEPWAIPGIGQLQGELGLGLRGLDGRWYAEQLSAELVLQQPLPDQQQRLPAALRADSLRLQLEAGEPLGPLPSNLAERSLPLAFRLHSQGPTPLELRGQLALANAPPWAAQFADVQLSASSPRLTQGNWTLHKTKADLRFNGYLDPEQLRIELQRGSALSLDRVAGRDLQLRRLRANLGGLQLGARLHNGDASDWHLQGPASIDVESLLHAALKPQGWRWQGRVELAEERLESSGELSADSDLKLPLQLRYDSERGLHAHAQLPELFLRAGNPLATTLAHWPALLELNQGRVSADAVIDLAPGHDWPDLKLELTGKDLAGIYDRTALSGLDARTQISLDHGRLQVALSDLRLKEANPGIPIGPLQLQADYSASIERPELGQLNLRLAQAGLMGGSVHVAANQWKLTETPLLIPVELRGLQLRRLFTLYPAEGLAGSGTFDGHLPLRLSRHGIQVDRGRIAARNPGGHLQLRSERIRALGSSNPTMQLVTQSLEDFHFTTLRSQVDYDPQGKLLLSMRLEGQNPAIEQGRPIHFNINLEEDIPSLLASLQLTDKVNEIIRRRVQQRILKRNAKAAPLEP
ncbi:intermembrane phospholipid transport protein YdbH family protein [Pseudomonas sp. MBLB4136]|uniref:intermembrane phospholipid transport protein YdbH family protein n=1 Tax=Pseudomonas sp. MBLB4136 TaxID=3451558 RepID=UPI003F752EA3